MIEVANGSMNGVYIVMKSEKRGMYPKLVVWPKGDTTHFYERYVRSHNVATCLTFNSADAAKEWIRNNSNV